MIDTIAWLCSLPIDLQKYKEIEIYLRKVKSYYSQSRIGLRLFITEINPSSKVLTKVECELPKLLHGNNARLIQSSEELTQAIGRLERIIERIVDDSVITSLSTGESVLTKGHFTRLDFVWQYPFPIQTFRNVLQHAKHPSIHRAADLLGNGNIVFKGRNLRISVYDKFYKCRKEVREACDHDYVTRVEFQLRSKKLIAQKLGVEPSSGLQSLSFPIAYPKYRELLLDFTNLGNHSDTDSTSITSFLAAEANRDPAIVERYIASKRLSAFYASRVRRGITAIKMESFDLSDLVPRDSLPPIVEVPDVKKEERFRAFIENVDQFQ